MKAAAREAAAAPSGTHGNHGVAPIFPRMTAAIVEPAVVGATVQKLDSVMTNINTDVKAAAMEAATALTGTNGNKDVEPFIPQAAIVPAVMGETAEQLDSLVLAQTVEASTIQSAASATSEDASTIHDAIADCSDESPMATIVLVKGVQGMTGMRWSPGADRALSLGVSAEFGGGELTFFQSLRTKNVVGHTWYEECEAPTDMPLKFTIYQADDNGHMGIVARATLDLLGSAELNGELPLEMDGNPTGGALMIRIV